MVNEYQSGTGMSVTSVSHFGLQSCNHVWSMAGSDTDDGAAVLVGRLIRSYRDDVRLNGRRLSQDGLLTLMVERGEGYAADLDRSNVSRWESGARLPPREFLVAFGRSLRLPEPEMDRMLVVAGYDSLTDEEGQAALLAAAQSLESQVVTLQREVRGLVDSTATPAAVDATAVMMNALRRMAPTGIYALVVGFVLNALGQNGTLALLGYVLVGFAIVIGQWALRWLKTDRGRTEHDHVVDLFFISLFFLLNTNLLIGVLTRADHFGFYTLGALTNTPMPFLFTMLVNLALALIASIMFSVLWTRQQGSGDGRISHSRAVWITLPPILLTYANVVMFTNLGTWIYFMVVFGILFGAFTIIVALNEPGTSLGDFDSVFRTAIVAMALLCSFGVAGTLATYLAPDAMVTASEFRIVPLPEIGAEELGYTPEEGVELMRLGNLWMSLASIVYLVTVLGGYLLVTIRRAGP